MENDQLDATPFAGRGEDGRSRVVEVEVRDTPVERVWEVKVEGGTREHRAGAEVGRREAGVGRVEVVLPAPPTGHDVEGVAVHGIRAAARAQAKDAVRVPEPEGVTQLVAEVVVGGTGLHQGPVARRPIVVRGVRVQDIEVGVEPVEVVTVGSGLLRDRVHDEVPLGLALRKGLPRRQRDHVWAEVGRRERQVPVGVLVPVLRERVLATGDQSL